MQTFIGLDLETTQIVNGVTPDIHCVGLVGGRFDTVLKWGKLTAALLKHVIVDEPDVMFVIHNAAFDVKVLRYHGVDIPPNRYVCTMVAAHAINPQMHNFSLKAYGESVDDCKIDYEAALIAAEMWEPSAKGDKSFYDLPFNPLMESYCLQDTRLALQYWGDCQAHFEHDERLRKFYWEVALPFIEVIMSLGGGLHVDLQAMLKVASELMPEINAKSLAFEQAYPRCVGISWDKVAQRYNPKNPPEFHTPNLGSPNDVCSLLMSHGWVPDDFKVHTGRPVTSQNTLKRLVATPDVNPVLKQLAERIAELRSLIGIQQQCIQVLTLTHHDSGLLYSNWQQTGTKTGRMSSASPNAQNFSTRHPVWGARFRGCFTPPEGYDMLCGDLSQIELGILAYYLEILCGDSAMADGNRAGKDAHDTNTTNWYGVEKGDANFKLKRANAKNGIFAAGYGAKAKRLSLTLNIPLTDAQEILNVVDETTDIAKLKQMMYKQMRQDRDIKPIPVPGTHRRTTKGVFYDCMGSRGFYPGITATDKGERGSAERQSFNALCQRGCSSILYSLLNRCLPNVQQTNGWFAGVVHDEALIYVPKASSAGVLRHCNEVFNSMVLPTPQGGVFVRAEFHVVNSWSDK